MSDHESNSANDGQSRLTVGLGLSDRLRDWIPAWDGYNAVLRGTSRIAAKRPSEQERTA